MNHSSVVLSQEALHSILSDPAVMDAREKLSSSDQVYFIMELPISIKETIFENFNLDIVNTTYIPMRWIKGDMVEHIDVGRFDFENTYLVYLTDSPGSFVVDGKSYPIGVGERYMFPKGLSHGTQGTNGTPRLLLGPMSEKGFPVGSPISYYATEADALTLLNSIGSSPGYTVETKGGYSSWRLASNSSGSSSQLVVYVTGDVLNSPGTYYLYPSNPCFLEGSSICCSVDEKETYVAIENIRKGTLVKTSRNGYKKVELIGKSTFSNPGTSDRTENKIYVCKKEKYPSLTEDLYITGAHSILVNELSDVERDATNKTLGKIFVTDKKYRLMVWLDEKAEPWDSKGEYTVWHIALENADTGMNYGIYANGGLLVESASIRFLRDKSNMELLE